MQVSGLPPSAPSEPQASAVLLRLTAEGGYWPACRGGQALERMAVSDRGHRRLSIGGCATGAVGMCRTPLRAVRAPRSAA